MISPIRQHWQKNEDFSDKPSINFDTYPTFSEATRQLLNLLKTGPEFSTLVELGSGDGRYLNYLSMRLHFLDIIGSDIENPRLHRARQEFPNLRLETGDALSMVKTYNCPGVIFVAMNVVSSLDPDEIADLFAAFTEPDTAFLFCDRGLTVETRDRFNQQNDQFNHNFIDLIRNSRFTIYNYSVRYDGNEERRATYIATAVVQKPAA